MYTRENTALLVPLHINTVYVYFHMCVHVLVVVATSVSVLPHQESSDGEDLESGGDDLSMEDSHQEDDGILDPPITHRVTLDSHWAVPSSRIGHTSHHHGSSSRSLSRPGSSANR